MLSNTFFTKHRSALLAARALSLCIAGAAYAAITSMCTSYTLCPGTAVPANIDSGDNGVCKCGGTQFPDERYNAETYWADVFVVPNTVAPAPPGSRYDVSDPSVPTGLIAVPLSTTENLVMWKASDDNVGVNGYDVFRNGTKIATTQHVTYYNDTGLAAGTSYTYTVRALDNANNLSTQTAGVAATTHNNGSNTVIGNTASPGTLLQELNNAYNAGAKSVTIRPGTYVLPQREGAATFLLEYMANFVINGYNVVLAPVETERSAFGISFSNNTVVRGITVQYNSPPAAQGSVIAMGTDGRGAYIDVQLEPGYHQTPNVSSGVNVGIWKYIGVVFDRDTRAIKKRTYNQESNEDAVSLGGGQWRLHSVHNNRGVAVGDPIAFRGMGHHLAMIWATFDSVLQDVTLRQGGSFGVKEDRSGRNHYYSLKITTGDKPSGATNAPLMSTSVDGIRSIQAHGGPDIQNATIENMFDDAMGVMGFYREVVSVSGTTLIVTPDPGNEQTYPSFHVGEPVRVTGQNNGYHEQATVTAVAMNGANVQLTLDKQLNAQPGFMVSNPEHSGAGFQYIKNTVRNNRAHGMILQASNAKVLNNTIDGSTISGMLFTAPELYFGGQADYPWNVTIEGNTIKNAGFATTDGENGGIYVGTSLPVNGLRGNRDFVIKNNVFDNVSGVNLAIDYAKGFNISNNSFLNAHQDAVETPYLDYLDPYYLIYLNECSDIAIANNVTQDQGIYHKGLLEKTASCQNVTSDWQ